MSSNEKENQIEVQSVLKNESEKSCEINQKNQLENNLFNSKNEDGEFINKEINLIDKEEDIKNADESDLNTSSVREKFNFGRNMIVNYGKEFLCILALILTTCATFQKIPPKISRAPTPKPFFTRSSLIHDSFTGSLSEIQQRVSLSEISLIFYYAPWCAESQHARYIYENVAQIYYREIHFGAINCWQPGSECRVQYAKVQSWPVLMAYYPNGLAVQYHGTWSNAGIIRFIKSLIEPVRRFATPEDLLSSTVSSDAVIVAYLDVRINREQYKTYYQTAIKWLERDPYQEIIFGIVTGQSSKSFGVTHTPTIRMYLWNETIEYSGNTSWTQTSTNKWIVDHIQQVSLWLSPPGTKSTSLAPYLKQGPVFLLFTHRNLYSDTIDGYNMLRQIGMEYYNCPRDDWVKEMARDYVTHKRKENYNNYLELKRKCETLFKNERHRNILNNKCHKNPVSVTFANVLNSSKSSSNDCQSIRNDNDFCDINPKNYNEHIKMMECDMKCNWQNICDDADDDDNLLKKSTILREIEREKIENIDPRLPKNLRDNELKQKCNLLKWSELENPTIFFGHDDQQYLELISGMACQMNSTFSLIAIDSLMYHTFAERLGIDILTIKNKSAAIIIDNENESTFRMDHNEITLKTITQFLRDYTRRMIPRYLRSDSVQYKHTHFYKIEEENLEKLLKKNEKRFKNSNRKSRSIKIKEIYSENFEMEVINSNQTVVILFHSSQCALCGLMSQNLLTIKNMLENLPNIKFVRIDGDKNDLTWFYTMTQFPSLVIFPGDNKSESRIYPINLKVNIKNILGFIMANLNRPTRLYAMILSCQVSNKMVFLDDCLETLRREISSNISYSLREWRMKNQIRRNILRRLQILRKIYLELLKINHSCDVSILESYSKYLIQIWTNNYNNSN